MKIQINSLAALERLNGNDLYDIKFFKFNKRTYDCPLVVEYNDVYCDMLSELWYSVTGLYLSL